MAAVEPVGAARIETRALGDQQHGNDSEGGCTRAPRSVRGAEARAHARVDRAPARARRRCSLSFARGDGSARLTLVAPAALLIFRRLEVVYLRGSMVRFVVLPEILKNAPIFKCVWGALPGEAL